MTKIAPVKHLGFSLKDEAWGIYCTSIDSFSESTGEVDDSRFEESGQVLKDFQLFYLTAGVVSFRCLDREEELGPGTLILIPPDLRHWLRPQKGNDWGSFSVSFAGKQAEALIASKFFTIAEMIHRVGIREPIVSAFARIAEVGESEPPCFQQILGALILEILAYVLSYDVAGVHDESEIEIMEKAKALFVEHMYKRVDMEQIAENLGIGYKTFCDLFRSYTGLTPYQYFLNMKINKAKEMLSEGKLSVKEVSYKLAFQTPYYFSRFFKIKTGMPPSKWNGLDLEDL